MIQKIRKTGAKARGRENAAIHIRQRESKAFPHPAFDLIAYTAALEILG